MATAEQHRRRAKISPEFAARLSRLRPQEKVRAIVVLQMDDHEHLRRSRRDRQAMLRMVQESAKPALVGIDGILQRFGGQRLTTANALGTVPVETTPAGISELAASEHVKAVLEDQPISLLHKAGLARV